MTDFLDHLIRRTLGLSQPLRHQLPPDGTPGVEWPTEPFDEWPTASPSAATHGIEPPAATLRASELSTAHPDAGRPAVGSIAPKQTIATPFAPTHSAIVEPTTASAATTSPPPASASEPQKPKALPAETPATARQGRAPGITTESSTAARPAAEPDAAPRRAATPLTRTQPAIAESITALTATTSPPPAPSAEPRTVSTQPAEAVATGSQADTRDTMPVADAAPRNTAKPLTHAQSAIAALTATASPPSASAAEPGVTEPPVSKAHGFTPAPVLPAESQFSAPPTGADHHPQPLREPSEAAFRPLPRATAHGHQPPVAPHPTVTVTIGTVVVRPAPVSATKPTGQVQPRRPAPNALSLDDYLSTREGRAR
jgi:hypothetical protein